MCCYGGEGHCGIKGGNLDRTSSDVADMLPTSAEIGRTVVEDCFQVGDVEVANVVNRESVYIIDKDLTEQA